MTLKIALVGVLLSSTCIFAGEFPESSTDFNPARARESSSRMRKGREPGPQAPAGKLVINVPVVGEVDVGEKVAEGAWKAGEAITNWQTGTHSKPGGPPRDATSHGSDRPTPTTQDRPSGPGAQKPSHIGPQAPTGWKMPLTGTDIGETVAEGAWKAGTAFGEWEAGTPTSLVVPPEYHHSTSGSLGKPGMR